MPHKTMEGGGVLGVLLAINLQVFVLRLYEGDMYTYFRMKQRTLLVH